MLNFRIIVVLGVLGATLAGGPTMARPTDICVIDGQNFCVSRHPTGEKKSIPQAGRSVLRNKVFQTLFLPYTITHRVINSMSLKAKK